MTSGANDYIHSEIEEKAKNIWSINKITTTEDSTKKKLFIVEMFPYPSGDLHMGHLLNYALGDVLARYKRALGFNVLHPQGWDAFGLPAENAARLNNIHPMDWTYENIDQMGKQLRSLGISYDWDRSITTSDCSYYEHEQRLFLKMLKAGLAYQKESCVNWDPVDQTVLANEQVIDGKGWRSGAQVQRKKLNQWFFKISNYSEDLLSDLDSLEWPEKVKIMQKNWIGKSKGFVVKFVSSNNISTIEIFTTRIETIMGAAFIGLSADHALLHEIWNPLSDVTKETIKLWRQNQFSPATDKPQLLALPIKVMHPLTELTIGVFVANYVLSDVGTGAIFGCPGHDARDRDAAETANISYRSVLEDGLRPGSVRFEDCEESDKLINSGEFTGMTVADARNKIEATLEAMGVGAKKTIYRLRDWGISRQRYWGCPIPIIICNFCGPVPVPEKDLPVTLPYKVSFDFKGNPLASNEEWLTTICPECNKPAKRETDTFDTFFESSWYCFAYCDKQAPLTNLDKSSYWMPVDYYIGGVEHAILHLLYSRFICRVLNEFGQSSVKEPFKQLFAQGMVCHQTYKNAETGEWLSPSEAMEMNKEKVIECGVEKMSKSKKNTIKLADALVKFGADATRFFILSNTPPDKDIEWSNRGAEAAFKFLASIDRWATEVFEIKNSQQAENVSDEVVADILEAMYKAAKEVGRNIDKFHTNVAIAKIHIAKNSLFALKKTEAACEKITPAILILMQILWPFAPHLAQTIWSKFSGQEIALDSKPWPKSSEAEKQQENFIIAVQVNGKTKGTVTITNQENDSVIKEKAKTFLLSSKRKIDLSNKSIIMVKNKIINFVDKK